MLEKLYNPTRACENDMSRKRELRVLRKEAGVSTNHRFLDPTAIAC
jgi:hypothetical protein